MDKEDIKMITKICYMYYFQDEVQTKIAKKFNITRQMVSRLIQKARDEGIVEININSPVKSVSSLESEIEKRFGLTDSIVIQEDFIDEEQMLQKLGFAAGDYFLKTVMSNMYIGIGFGQTLESMAEYVSQSAVSNSIQGVTLTQLIGGLYSNLSYENSQYIMSLLGKKLNSNLMFLNTPFMVEEPSQRSVFLEQASTKDVFKAYASLDMSFVEIKAADKVYRMTQGKESKFGLNYLNTLGISYLNNVDAEGEICLNYLNDRGSVIETQLNNKVIGIHHKQLESVKNLVGIVGGEKRHKIALSVLKAGMINTLVTDEATARYILDNA